MQINANSIDIGYGSYTAVRNMDIEIKKGEITSIIGPNGSGKSTVLKALTRLLPYKSGAINVCGTDIKDYNNKELSKIIAVLPQKHSAPPDFKVKDLVGYGRVPYQNWYAQNSEEDIEIINWAMEMTGVEHLKEKSINSCSGGEAQRVWIATVLAQQPEILFLDEPTTYLDIAHQHETMQLAKKLNRESGIGVVMVLHDLTHALEVSDKIVVIKDGVKYSQGTPEEVITTTMLKEVYGVTCDIVNIPGRSKPTILFEEIS